MSIGLLRSDVVVDNLADGVMRYRFHPTIADQMKFKTNIKFQIDRKVRDSIVAIVEM
mgnify:CR=1 FL=1